MASKVVLAGDKKKGTFDKALQCVLFLRDSDEVSGVRAAPGRIRD
jgi:hypothetical protein